MRVPAAGGNFFWQISKCTIFFTKYVIFIVCSQELTLYFDRIITNSVNNIHFYPKFDKNFESFDQMFEFCDPKFVKKRIFFEQKIENIQEFS